MSTLPGAGLHIGDDDGYTYPEETAGEITIPRFGFRPWNHQLALWNYFLKDDKAGKRAVCCWHRRAGKDLLMLQVTLMKLLERPGIYWHLLPQFNQARRVIWEGVTSDGIKFLDYIPPQLIERKRDDSMTIWFKNGSIWSAVGSDQPDRLVGSNPMGVVFSEYALSDPTCYDYIRPILAANGGWAAFISTPRGQNAFFDMYKQAGENPDWFSELLTVDDTLKPDGTPIVTQEIIDEDIRSGMLPELADQEYRCSFTAALAGSFYGKEMEKAAAEGRVGSVPYRPDLPVYTTWDLGMDDAMVILFYQMVGEWLHIIDYHAEHGFGLDHYAKVLQDKPYVYKRHVAPHDIKVREMGTGISRLDTARKLGIKFDICPRLSVEDGISACRLMIARCKFDAEKANHLIRALQSYHKDYDPRTKTWGKPKHDWSSHGADTARYMALTVPKKVYQDKTPPIWGKQATFSEVMDGIVSKARKKRAKTGRKWI